MGLSREHVKTAVRKVTGTGIGHRTSTFLHGLAWLLTGAMVARVLSGFATLWAARCLGPAAFGEVSLALAASMAIQIPLFWGLPTALMHYLPTVNKDDKPLWSATGFALFFIYGLMTLLAATLLRHPLMRWLGLSTDIFHWTLYWCIGFAIYTAVVSWVSGEEQFAKRARMEVAFAALLFIFVAWLRWQERVTPAHYILSYSASYALIGLMGLYGGRRLLSFSRFTMERMRPIIHKLFGYGSVAAIDSVRSALFLASGRLLANHYLSAKDVGLLAVYQAASIQMASFGLSAGIQAFFPIASRTPDKVILLKKINHVLLITLVPCIIGLVFLIALYFKLLGKHYPFDFTNAAVYSVAAYLSLVFGVLAWYYAAIGKQGIITQTVVGLFAGAVNLVACWLLIPAYHVIGAGWAYALGTVVGIVMLYLPITQRLSGLTATGVHKTL